VSAILTRMIFPLFYWLFESEPRDR
jgi:hypothetical protein